MRASSTYETHARLVCLRPNLAGEAPRPRCHLAGVAPRPLTLEGQGGTGTVSVSLYMFVQHCLLFLEHCFRGTVCSFRGKQCLFNDT